VRSTSAGDRAPDRRAEDAVSRGHRLRPVEVGPILSPRRIDVVPEPPTGTDVLLGHEAGPGRHSDAARTSAVEGAGWSVSSSGVDADGRSWLVADGKLRMDGTVLLWTRLGLLAFAIGLAAAVATGLDLSARGLPAWQGDLLIALGAVGAVGFVALLPRVEFVGEFAVVRFAPPGPLRPASTAGGNSNVPGLEFEVWVAWARSRNWEVLGDRGGRRVVAARAMPESAERARELVSALSEAVPVDGQNLPAGFK
jgi:hypothetical protein